MKDKILLHEIHETCEPTPVVLSIDNIDSMFSTNGETVINYILPDNRHISLVVEESIKYINYYKYKK